MKFCVAWMQQNEAHWLRLHLPAILKDAEVDALVALDGGSTDDSVEVARSFGATVFHRPFDWSFSNQANALIEACESLSMDALLRLDPDELCFSAGIATIRRQLETTPTLCLPRVNFEGDRLHWRPADFPDYQLRAFRLNQGYRYVCPVHEILADTNRRAVDGPRSGVTLFHYEAIRPNDVRRFNKHHNYALLAQGKAPIELPDDFPVPNGFLRKPCELFDSEQPLDPMVVGIHAPFTMEENDG